MNKKAKVFLFTIAGLLCVVASVKAATVIGNNITTSGYIGIGTTTPTDSLQIDGGNILFSGVMYPSIILGNSANALQVRKYNDGFHQVEISNKDIHAYGTATSSFRINSDGDSYISSGNVGIGTTTPQTQLHLFGDLNNAVFGNATFRIEGRNPALELSESVASTDNKNWILYANNSVLRGAAAEDGWANGDHSWLEVRRNGILGISSVSFPEGNVGIGTTTPAHQLTIGSDANNQFWVDGGNMSVGDMSNLKGGAIISGGKLTVDNSFYTDYGTSTVEVGGSDHSTKGSCLKLRDSDGAGWTYCTVLNGSLTCSQTSCE
ncbi:MAG: hypothetical protein WCK37_03320 [Candidatus Falkowbacteria bacterium]